MAEKTRYSDEELQEFKELILEKLDKARKDYDLLKGVISGSDGNDIADTCPTFKVLEEGASVLSKEEAGRLADDYRTYVEIELTKGKREVTEDDEREADALCKRHLERWKEEQE